jgi:hypothetical protein
MRGGVIALLDTKSNMYVFVGIFKNIEVVKGKGRREREGEGHSEYVYYCCKGNSYVYCYEGS